MLKKNQTKQNQYLWDLIFGKFKQTPLKESCFCHSLYLVRYKFLNKSGFECFPFGHPNAQQKPRNEAASLASRVHRQRDASLTIMAMRAQM